MKLKSPYLLCATVALLLFAIKVKAQSTNYFIPSVFQKSPNSTAFAKYGDYPVNLYTGLPDISIPLYTVESGGLQVPITLSYHASGLKVNEIAGYVGAGWSLNAGGSITRQVVGMPDDGGTTGYFAGYRRDTSIHQYTVHSDLDYLYYTVTRNAHDNRPDIFSYDVPGHGGKFFYDATASYKVRFLPFAPLSIIKTATDTPRFTIIDERGTIFKLGYNYREMTSTPTYAYPGTLATTAWKLENMISQNRRDTISFSYIPRYMTPPDQVGQVTTVEDQQVIVLGGGGPTTYAQAPVTSVSNTTTTVTEQEISQITFKNGKVTFAANTNRSDITPGKRLDSMKVYAYNFGLKKYELQKSIVFYESYFSQYGGGNGRLRLDSIQILDKAGSIMQHYRFVYNNQTVPAYQSYSRDFWGYYNGKMNGVSSPTLIPQMTIDYYWPNASSPNSPLTIGASSAHTRDPDSTFMQAGVLKTIYYPTGGHTTFAYQTNRYLDSAGGMHLTGGLRIDSISSYDGISSTPIVKTYQYNKTRPNFMTSGFTGLLNYGFFVHSLNARYFTGGNNGVAATKRVRAYYSESSLNLTGSEGNPVAYANVTEYIGTPGTNTGKSVYTFRDHSDSWDGSILTTRVPITLDYFFARGQLLSKTDYMRKSDGTYQIVKKATNSYSAYAETLYSDVGMVVGQVNQTDGVTIAYPMGTSDDDGGSYPYTSYSIVSDDNYETGSTTQIYDTNDTTKYTVTSTNYTYGDVNYQQIANITHVDSKGNTHITNTRYPFDYLNGGTTTNNVVLDSMLNRHMYSEVIEKYDSLRNVTTSLNAVTSAQLNQFQFGYIPYTIVPAKKSVLGIVGPVNNFFHSRVSSGNLTGDMRYKQMISFDAYDAQNNIAQYTPRNSAPISILWGYQYDLPIAQIKNATYSHTVSTQVAYTSFETPRNDGWSYSGTPIKDVTAPTGIFVYPLIAGSVTLTYFDNTKSYVLSMWSNNGAPTIYAGSYLTGSPLKTTNGWTYYEYTVPVSATAITISGTTSIDELRLYPVAAQMTTYAYDPSGIRSIMDVKSEANYFEYDPFQRLKNMKDYNGNIVNSYGYHTYDQTVTNDAIAATVFTRDNCPSGTTPQSTTYSVPAGRYVSSTKASANGEAQYDLQTNGQAKADNPAICGCPIQTISFTLTNSSGYTGWQAVFTGGSNPTYNFPSSGSAVVQVPAGTYSSVYIGPIGSATHTFTLGSRTPITGAHSATFTAVVISSSSTDSSLKIQ